MLVISRKSGQKIMLNDNIVITVVDVTNGQCKLAIEADSTVKIYREEIYYKIKLANLIGQNSNKNEVDSVTDLVNNANVKINDDIIKNQKSDEEICDNKNYSKKIVINKKNQDKNS